MALSNDLISKFVKVTKNDSNKKKTETTVYGTTVERDGRMWVKIDGSDLLTPISSTAEVRENERVTVMVKNHTATITGNMSSPAVRTGTVAEMQTTVDTSIKGVSVLYATSDDPGSIPASGWSIVAPEWKDGQYVWQKTVTVLNNGNTVESAPTCITGATGASGGSGQNGEDGRGVVSIITQFAITTDKTVVPNKTSDEGWFDSMPDWNTGDYLWTRSKIFYTDSDKPEYTEPQLDGSWEVANKVSGDLADALNTIDAQLMDVDTRIEELPTAIINTVEGTYLKSNDFEVWKQTELVQTVDGLTINFATKASLDDTKTAIGTNTSNIAEILSHIEFVEGDILLHNSESPIQLRLENNRIAFSHKDSAVLCYITESDMGILSLKVTGEAQLAGLKFYKAENRSICIN